MKVLISAYACEPDRGSEAAVGLQTVLAAARQHDVWVLTRANHSAALSAHLESVGLSDRVRVQGFDVPGPVLEKKKRNLLRLHHYYNTWQERAGILARQLDREVDFDLVHHVTMASYWTQVGVASVGKPLVWGPVGGAVDAPWRLLPALGWPGLFQDSARMVIRRLVGSLPRTRRTRDAASLILAQNRETVDRLKATDKALILPNATAAALEAVPGRNPGKDDIVFVGRLMPLKGGVLAIRALSYLKHQNARLRVFGEGTEKKRMERVASRSGVEDRVEFCGLVPRRRLLEEVATASVLVCPSIHDESNLAVAEALAAGTPVVCLDRGGPLEVASRWPAEMSELVEPSWPGQTAKRFAAAMDRLLELDPNRRPGPILPNPKFADEILRSYQVSVSRPDLP